MKTGRANPLKRTLESPLSAVLVLTSGKIVGLAVEHAPREILDLFGLLDSLGRSTSVSCPGILMTLSYALLMDSRREASHALGGYALLRCLLKVDQEHNPTLEKITRFTRHSHSVLGLRSGFLLRP